MLSTFKALADPTRLRLMAVLARGEFTVQELTTILDMGQSRVSRHLKILTQAGLLSVKREGTWAYYRLEGNNPFFTDIRALVESKLHQDPSLSQDRDRLLVVLEDRRCRSLDFFDRHARQWDELVRDSLPTAAYQSLLLETVPDLKIALEIGVGTGNLLEGLRCRAQRVIGVDHSPVMLEQARQRVEHAGFSGIELRLGEMRHLPVSNNEVQWAVLNMVLHHAALPQQVFHELSRVLCAGGGITLADLHRHEDEWVRDRMADQWLGFERAELESWLLAAGFELRSFQLVSGSPAEHSVVLLSAVKKNASAHGAFL
jgi:ArsR family transcriptional regulator